MDRFESTTEHLRDVAAALLVELGPRAFTQEALAARGFVAIGTVYQRWSSRVDALVDIADSRLLPALENFAGDIEELLDSPDGRNLLRLLSDVLLATRDHSELVDPANKAIEHLIGIVTRHGDVEDITWWLTAFAVGWGMLLAGREDLPPITDGIRWITGPDCTNTKNPRHVTTGPFSPIIPPTPPTEPTDEKGKQVKAAAREMLTTKERPGFNTRDLSNETGISTGSLYRRFPSRSELLRALLVDEVQSERYAWTTDMISALTSDDPLLSTARVATDVLLGVYDNRDAQRLILEITVAARTEDTLRLQLVGQINAVVDARCELFTRLQQAGVITSGITADQLSWGFQTAPIGARLLGSLGHRPTDAEVSAGIRRVLQSLVGA